MTDGAREIHAAPTGTGDEVLYRRVPLDTVNTAVRDTGEVRPSSAAFELDADETGLSVFVGSELTRIGRAPADVVDGHPGYGVAAVPLEAVLAAADDLTLVADPILEAAIQHPCDPAHALVVGLEGLGRKASLKARRRIALASYFIDPPSEIRDH